MRWIDDGDDEHQIPEWLQRGEEYDAVDWETVAAYAAQKPRMAPDLARTLILRFERHIGRPEAVARAWSEREGRAIAAAWKWIDRNWKDRIAPLFQAEKPQWPLADTHVQGFPMLASGVSLRLDTYVQWDRARLVLVREGLPAAEDGTFPVYRIEADSMESAVQSLRCAAAAEEMPELFHIWPIRTSPSPDPLRRVRLVTEHR
jgi:hypothetical protein